MRVPKKENVRTKQTNVIFLRLSLLCFGFGTVFLIEARSFSGFVPKGVEKKSLVLASRAGHV